jgi:hypothetical protein
MYCPLNLPAPSSIWFPFIVTLVSLAAGGCGTSQYDAVARARADSLRSGALEGVQVDAAEWQPYASPQNYTVDLPATPQPVTQDEGGTVTEMIKITVGDLIYEVNFVRADGIDLKAVADEMSAVLVGEGFKRTGGTARNTNGLVRQDIQFETGDKTRKAMLRVFELDTARVCALSVIGSEIPPDDVKRFFDSLKIADQ